MTDLDLAVNVGGEAMWIDPAGLEVGDKDATILTTLGIQKSFLPYGRLAIAFRESAVGSYMYHQLTDSVLAERYVDGSDDTPSIARTSQLQLSRPKEQTNNCD